MPIITLRPLSDYYVSIHFIVPTSPTTHFDKVDEAVADDADNVYVQGSTPPNIGYDLYNLTQGLIAAGSFINYVKICFRGIGHNSQSDVMRYGMALKTHDTLYRSRPFTSFVWEDHYIQYDKNPFTNNYWTPEEVDALLAGADVDVDGVNNNNYTRISQFYVEVSYEGIILLSGILLMPRFEAGSKQVTLRAHITAGTATGTAWFEYGLTTSYGSETPHQYPVFDGDFISHQCNLERNTLYHYRFAIKVVDETWYSNDQTIRIDDKILYKLGKVV